MNKIEEYKHNNQTLLFEEPNTYILVSYSTEVLKVVNGQIVLDQYSKISVTTSKHITFAKRYLMEKGIITN